MQVVLEGLFLTVYKSANNLANVQQTRNTCAADIIMKPAERAQQAAAVVLLGASLACELCSGVQC